MTQTPAHHLRLRRVLYAKVGAAFLDMPLDITGAAIVSPGTAARTRHEELVAALEEESQVVPPGGAVGPGFVPSPPAGAYRAPLRSPAAPHDGEPEGRFSPSA